MRGVICPALFAIGQFPPVLPVPQPLSIGQFFEIAQHDRFPVTAAIPAPPASHFQSLPRAPGRTALLVRGRHIRAFVIETDIGAVALQNLQHMIASDPEQI